MPARGAARGTIQLVISQVCLFGSGYLITVFLARGLGPEDYGIYGVILSILSWAEQISRFGIPGATSKLIAEDTRQASGVAQTAWVLGVCLLALAFAVFWGAAPLLAHLFHLPDGVPLLRLAALDIPFYGMYFIYRGVSGGHRAFATLSVAGAVYGVSKVVGVLGLYALGLSIQGALIVNILGSVAALLFIAARTPVKPGPWQHAVIVPMLRLAFPLALGVLVANILYHLDLWSLKIVMADEKPGAIGVYIAASQVAKIPQLGVLAVTVVLFSSLARALGNQDLSLAQRYVQGAMRFLWVALLPFAVLIALEADNIMTLLYSTRYSTGGPLLRLIVVGWSLFAFLDTFSTMFQARGEVYFSAGIGFILVIALALLNLTLIPLYGPLGAAMATTLTMGLGALITGILAYRRFGALIQPSTLVKGIVAAAIMAIIDTQVSLPGLLLPLQYLSLLGIYALILAVLGELKREDVQPLLLWRREPV
jgi:stage V sporulation protein B